VSICIATQPEIWKLTNNSHRSYATLKVFTREGIDEDEYDIYQILSKANSSHPGYSRVRKALEIFTIPRPGGDHRCLVQKPMGDSFTDILTRNPTYRFPTEMLKAGLAQVLLALDYFHSECKIVHTGKAILLKNDATLANGLEDIKEDGILTEIEDDGILKAFVEAELTSPSPRKFVGGAPIYASRRLGLPKHYGDIVLGDFGSAVRGDKPNSQDVQPNVYRCPEVMLKTGWSYPADIWNVGAMVCYSSSGDIMS
jgi:serine/threonine-protein kinase SRPK3